MFIRLVDKIEWKLPCRVIPGILEKLRVRIVEAAQRL